VLPLTPVRGADDAQIHVTASQPLSDTTHAGTHYRERANRWQASVAALPAGAPQQATYLQIAEGYEKIATHYEARERA
jgi:hypothetical protein